MSAYWLGVATPFLVAGVGLAGFAIWVRAVEALAARGFTVEMKWRRNAQGISRYVIEHDIWWERSFGPVFAGGWYREPPRYEEPLTRLVNRWIGVGRVDGPCVMFFRCRDLGSAPS